MQNTVSRNVGNQKSLLIATGVVDQLEEPPSSMGHLVNFPGLKAYPSKGYM